MFRPAGFSDSDESEGGYSSRRHNRNDESSDNSKNGTELRNIIPWDTLNNNIETSSVAVADTILTDPALLPLLEKTKKYLRSTLLSHKGGVEMFALDSDYYELVGERTPYSKLKFNSLERLLRALPSVCELWRSGGQVMVKGVAGEASQHTM